MQDVEGECFGDEGSAGILSLLAERDPEKTKVYHGALLSSADIISYREYYDEAAVLLEDALEEMHEECDTMATERLGKLWHSVARGLLEEKEYASASRAAFENRE